MLLQQKTLTVVRQAPLSPKARAGACRGCAGHSTCMAWKTRVGMACNMCMPNAISTKDMHGQKPPFLSWKVWRGVVPWQTLTWDTQPCSTYVCNRGRIDHMRVHTPDRLRGSADPCGGVQTTQGTHRQGQAAVGHSPACSLSAPRRDPTLPARPYATSTECGTIHRTEQGDGADSAHFFSWNNFGFF